ncbi:MAG: hypothetical protein QW413_03545 [Nitrososphaerota archaeon]
MLLIYTSKLPRWMLMMEYRRLGKTDEKIPVIGIGTWKIGGGMTPDYSRDEEAVEALKIGRAHV